MTLLLALFGGLLFGLLDVADVDVVMRGHELRECARVEQCHEAFAEQGLPVREVLTVLVQLVAATEGVEAGDDHRLQRAVRQRRKFACLLHLRHQAADDRQLQLLCEHRVDATEDVLQLLRLHPDLFRRDPLRVADGSGGEQEGVAEPKRQVVDGLLGDGEVVILLDLQRGDVLGVALDELTRLGLLQRLDVRGAVRAL